MANGASLVPDISPFLQALQQFTPRAREDRAFQLQQREQQLAGLGQQQELRAGEIAGQEQQQTIRDLQIQQAQRQQQIQQAIGVGNEAITAFDEDIFDINIVTKGGPTNLRNSIARLAAERGPDDPDFQEFAEMAQRATEDPEGTFKELISTRDNIAAQKKITIDSINRLRGRQPQGFAARSFRPTEFANGTTITFDSAGNRQVRDGAGNIVTGQQAQETIDAGVQSGIVQAGVTTGTKAAADAAIKRSEVAFDQISKIRTNITNLDEAIRLSEAGAGTGPIQSLFPSIRQSSIELDNLRGRLGLDVVSATTFGALSESELKFALDTALPLKLKGPALRDWLRRKKSAQEKLSSNLEELASFLGTPGNTTAKFLKLKKSERDEAKKAQQELPTLAEQEAQAAQPVTIIDDQGNRLQLINNQWVPIQ